MLHAQYGSPQNIMPKEDNPPPPQAQPTGSTPALPTLNTALSRTSSFHSNLLGAGAGEMYSPTATMQSLKFNTILRNVLHERRKERIEEAFDKEDGQLADVEQTTWLADKKKSWAARYERHFNLESAFPFLYAFKGYRPMSFVRDLVTALTMCFIVIGQAIGFASAANLDLSLGLLSAAYCSMMYFFIGKHKAMIIAPEATTAVILLGCIDAIREKGGGDISANSIAIVVSFIGAVLYGVLFASRLGYIAHIFSGSLLVGFMSAVGFYIMVGALSRLLGQDATSFKYSVVKKFQYIGQHADQIDANTVILSVCSLAFLFTHKALHHYFPKNKVIRHFPATLILLVASMILSATLDFPSKGINTVGLITNKFQVPGIPYIPQDYWDECFTSAILLAIVGFTESMFVVKELSRNSDVPTVQPNREALVLSVTNTFASLFGGMASIGSHAASVVAEETNPASTLAIFLTGGFIAIVYGLLPIVEAVIPIATIAATLFFAGFNLIRWRDIWYIIQKRDFGEIALLLVAFFATIFVNIEIGILVCLLLSLMIIARHSTKVMMHLLGLDPLSKKWVNIEDHFDCEIVPGVLVIQINSNLLFFNSEKLLSYCQKLEATLERELQKVASADIDVEFKKGSYVAVNRKVDAASEHEDDESSKHTRTESAGASALRQLFTHRSSERASLEDTITADQTQPEMIQVKNTDSAPRRGSIFHRIDCASGSADPINNNNNGNFSTSHSNSSSDELLLIEDVVFDLSGCRIIDPTAAVALYDMVKTWTLEDCHRKRVWFTNVNAHHREVLLAAKIVKNDALGETHIITHLEDCMAVVLDLHKTKVGTPTASRFGDSVVDVASGM